MHKVNNEYRDMRVRALCSFFSCLTSFP